MRKLILILAALAYGGAFATAGTAEAGHHKKKHIPKTYVCWTSVAGHTDCDWLPKRYFVPGVKRPTCCSVRNDTDRVDFYLTSRIIAALAAQGVRTDTMAPGHWAQLQAVCKKKKHH